MSEEIIEQINKIIKQARNYINDCKNSDASYSQEYGNKVHDKNLNNASKLDEELEAIKKQSLLNKHYEKIKEAKTIVDELRKESSYFNKL